LDTNQARVYLVESFSNDLQGDVFSGESEDGGCESGCPCKDYPRSLQFTVWGCCSNESSTCATPLQVSDLEKTSIELSSRKRESAGGMCIVSSILSTLQSARRSLKDGRRRWVPEKSNLIASV
jgi:hypothetical protein